jgi:hypothetical protein
MKTHLENLTALRNTVDAGFRQSKENYLTLVACKFGDQMNELFVKATMLYLLDDAIAFQKWVLPEHELNISSTYTHVFPDENDGEQQASTGEGHDMATNTMLAVLNRLIVLA